MFIEITKITLQLKAITSIKEDLTFEVKKVWTRLAMNIASGAKDKKVEVNQNLYKEKATLIRN